MTKEQALPVFVIDSSGTIKWPVVVGLPVDGGKIAEFQFTGIFKRMSDEELDKVLGVAESPAIKPGDADELAHGMLVRKAMQEVLRENAELFPQLLVGWDGIKNAAGEDVTFSVATLKAQAIGVNGVFLSRGLWRAISEIRHGARLGN